MNRDNALSLISLARVFSIYPSRCVKTYVIYFRGHSYVDYPLKTTHVKKHYKRLNINGSFNEVETRFVISRLILLAQLTRLAVFVARVFHSVEMLFRRGRINLIHVTDRLLFNLFVRRACIVIIV